MTTKTKSASAGAKAPNPAVKKPKATRATKPAPVATAPRPQPPHLRLQPADLAVLGEGHIAYVRPIRSEEVRRLFNVQAPADPDDGHHFLW